MNSNYYTQIQHQLIKITSIILLIYYLFKTYSLISPSHFAVFQIILNNRNCRRCDFVVSKEEEYI